MFTNLISNGLKFVAQDTKPRLRIWAEDRDNATRVWVEDNGIGIRADHQKRLFGVFQRLHSGELFPGTGIGLAIVRKGAERMGGRVGLESTPGQGSRFWIELCKPTHS
jgi:signal transduction histidine kinase